MRYEKRLPVHWSSQIPKSYNTNAITSHLNRATRMVSAPGNKILEIKHKFLNAVCPLRFINSVIKQFSQNSSEMDDFIIPPSLFETPQKVVILEIPYHPKNEASSKRFTQRFDELTNSLYDMRKSGPQKR